MKIDFPYTKELLILNNIFNKNNEDNLRIVGGAIRNYLIDRKINDFDLSTKLTPEESIELLKKNRIKAVPIGINFGTIIAIVRGKGFEITTARKDVKTDGRHAIVEFTRDFETDAKRRDFTFNALYLDFNGNVYDYFDGISDLRKGIVRFIGNASERIKEDYLRILRFFRFYCYYATVLDNEGLKYAIEYREKLRDLSGERIKAEMFKILIADYPIKTLEIMRQHDILQIITGLNSFDFGKLEILFSIKKFIGHEINAELVLSLLLKDMDELNILKEKWRLSKKENSEILRIIERRADAPYTEQDIAKFLFSGYKKDTIANFIIANAIINRNIIENSIIDIINRLIEYLKPKEPPVFPVTGLDLEEAGFTSKKQFGKLLNEGRRIFIESDYSMSKKKIIKHLKNYNNS